MENFKTEMPEDIVSLATAFPHGVGGADCICGALVGGTMALGMFFGRSAAKEDDKVTHGSPEHKQQCAGIAGEVTEETAKIIIREKGANILKR